MTDTGSVERYDFREPRQLADDVEHTLSAWAKSFAPTIADAWQTQMGIALQWSLKGLSTTRRSRIVETCGDSYVCCSLSFEAAEGQMCLMLPRPFVVGILLEMLGEPLTEVPEDRKLTDVELALLEVALRDAARHLTDCQPCAQPLICCFTEVQRTQDTFRKSADQEPIVQLSLQVTAAFGEQEVLWLLSQAAVLRFMTNVSESRVASAQDSARLEDAVRQIPLQVIVRLGKALVHVSDLINLQPGDIIVLDQRVTDPLAAEVNQVTKFHGWPGKVGRRQAFQVADAVTAGDR